jgi:PAS domain S-box-containing protein
MIKIFNKQDILKGFNFWAMIICIWFVVFLSIFVSYSQYYLVFFAGAVLFGINHFLIVKGYLRPAFIIFVLCTNSIMLLFDAGIMSPARGFIFYIPLLLCNLIITNFNRRIEQVFSILLTLLCICLTTFTDLTPKIAERLYVSEHQIIVSYFNTFAAIFMTVVIAYVLAKAALEAQQNLEQSKKILSQNEKLLESINQNIDIGICRTDVATNRLLYANKAKAKVFGYDSVEEILAISPNDFYKDEQERIKVIDRLERDGFVSNMEVQYKRKDGSHFWGLLTSNKTVDENGRILYDGALRDISDNKHLQEELIRAKDVAEKSSLAKSQFLSTMSHEIRTPMNAVIGASNLLLADETRPEQRENLLLLKSAGSNLMRLINNVLDFSKIELDKVEFEQVQVDLKQLILEAVDTHILEAQKKNITLTGELDELTHSYIIDPIRFIQVINNLLSNAVKFTDEGSVKIKVNVSEADSEHDWVTIAVIDTGIGIADERQQKIFESFSQENIDTTRRYGGSGLGLAITRRIIQKFNSQIKLTSEKGKGATFSFTLKLKRKVSVQFESPKPQQARNSLEGMRILVVEDNKMNILIIRKFLSRWNLKCDECESGEEALEKLKTQNYDLILMDLHMPDMDGFQTTAAIRAFDKKTPIFALTADAFAETRIRALAGGMNDFIPKPFDPDSLHTKIARVWANSLFNDSSHLN